MLAGIFVFFIAQIVSLGLAIPMIAVSELTMRGIAIADLKPIFVLSPMAGVGTAALLVWLLLHLIKIYYQAAEPPQAVVQRVGERPVVEIPATPDSAASVTEHTTRNFDPVYRGEIGARQ